MELKNSYSGGSDVPVAAVWAEPAYLVNLDTKAIQKQLETKLSQGESLDKEEQMQLMILPLTVKGKEQKQQVTMEAVKLVKQIQDQSQKNQILAGLLTFTDKIIDKACKEKIREELQMTQIGKMIFDDGYDSGYDTGVKEGEKRGEERGEKRGEKQGRARLLVEQSCQKLKKGKLPEQIAEELEEELEVIGSICQAAAGMAPLYDSNAVYEAWNASMEKQA